MLHNATKCNQTRHNLPKPATTRHAPNTAKQTHGPTCHTTITPFASSFATFAPSRLFPSPPVSRVSNFQTNPPTTRQTAPNHAKARHHHAGAKRTHASPPLNFTTNP
jgi:hypothetical protein